MTSVSSATQTKILQKLPGTIIADAKNFVTLQLSVDDWINVPGHPRQRDTLRHSKAAHWHTAQKATGALKIHLGHVVGAILNNTLYKIDGHTRAHLWETGQLVRPQHIIVTAYQVKDKQELNALYGVMDIASAAERPSDKISGAYQECGLTLTSKRLKNGNIGEALYMAARGEPKAKRSKKQQSFDLYEAVKIFAPELQIIDNLHPDPKIYCSGILAAALIMQTLNPKTLEFFRLLGDKRGEKIKGRMDPVESVLDVINDLKHSKQLYYGVGQLELCARCIRAVYNWLEGPESTRYWLKNKVYAYDLKPLIETLREKKGISNDSRL